MPRGCGVVKDTDPINQPRKHSGLKLLAELNIKNTPDGKPHGFITDRIVWALNEAGYYWDPKSKVWFKSQHPRHMTLEQRFWSRVDKRTENECWEWVNGSYYRNPHTGEDTYGCISFNGKRQGAHRCSWFLHFGDIPEGMVVMHKCDNPKCVNPNHLQLGTMRDNIHDRDRKGRTVSPPGELCGHAVLTNDQVRQIKQMIKDGYSHAEISSKFGVGKAAISLIRRGVNWRSVMIDPDEYLNWRPKYRDMYLASLQNKE